MSCPLFLDELQSIKMVENEMHVIGQLSRILAHAAIYTLVFALSVNSANKFKNITYITICMQLELILYRLDR